MWKMQSLNLTKELHDFDSQSVQFVNCHCFVALVGFEVVVSWDLP